MILYALYNVLVISLNNTMVEGLEGKLTLTWRHGGKKKEDKNKISSVCCGVISICMRHDFIDQVPVDGPTVIAQS